MVRWSLFGVAVLWAASAQAAWVPTGGPLGGLGYDVRLHPVTKRIMYVTDNFAGVQRSEDGGATWRAANRGISVRAGVTGDAFPIFSLTVDPNDPSIVWAGTNGEGGQFGIFRSADGGATWTLKASGVSAGEHGIVFRGFTVQPGNSRVVWAMAEVPTAEWGREFNRVRGRVYRSTDGGESWSLLWDGENLARYLIVDPTNPSVLYLSTGIFDREADNSDCGAGRGGGLGVLKSTDGGATWAPANAGLTDLYVGSLRMHPANPAVLFAATGNNACSGGYEGAIRSGLFRTTNGGATWAKVLAGDIFTTVNFAPSAPGVVYAGSARAFYRSADGGDTWSVHAKPGGQEWGPEGVRAGVPIDVVVDPDDPDLLYANNYGGGVFRSRDGARTWEIWSRGYSGAQVHAVHVPATSSSTVLAVGRSGPYRSANYGGDWTGIGTGEAEFPEWNTVAARPDDHQTILLADEHQGKIMLSRDGGASFTIVFTHPLADAADVNRRQGFKTLVFAPSDPRIVYAGLARDRGALDSATPVGRVLYTSTDGGQRFAPAGGDLDGRNVRRLVVHPGRADTIWAATSGGVWASTDGGGRWSLLGLAGRNIAALAVDAGAGVLVAAEKDAGIWLSEDGGAAWSGPHVAGFNNPNPYVQALLFDATGALYAGDYYSGVYRSADRGRTWSPFPDAAITGLGVRAVRDLALGRGVLYAATEGGGVFRHGDLPSGSVPAFGASAEGPLSGRTLTVTLEPPLADLGAPRQVFIAAVLGSRLFFFTREGWRPWSGGAFPAYVSGPLASLAVRVLDGTLDLRSAEGAAVYVGYGTDGDEMLAAGRYALVHTLR
jgi:hypothetical protein